MISKKYLIGLAVLLVFTGCSTRYKGYKVKAYNFVYFKVIAEGEKERVDKEIELEKKATAEKRSNERKRVLHMMKPSFEYKCNVVGENGDMLNAYLNAYKGILGTTQKKVEVSLTKLLINNNLEYRINEKYNSFIMYKGIGNNYNKRAKLYNSKAIKGTGRNLTIDDIDYACEKIK